MGVLLNTASTHHVPIPTETSPARWDYAAQAVDTIAGVVQLTKVSTVADVGASGGALSRHFVELARLVYGIEPDIARRQSAARLLRRYPSFCPISGRAEATGLPSHTVDLVVTGRAFYRFEAEATRQEFLRILKPGGWLGVLRITCLEHDYLALLQEVCAPDNGWSTAAEAPPRPPQPAGYYFGHEDYLQLRFQRRQLETWPEFRARLCQNAAAPAPGHPRYGHFVEALRELFACFSHNGRLSLNTATDLALGQMEAD